MHDAMNGEYAGFFDIGMVQRNEANAIITHGTMCLIRRTALEGASGWSSDTICEDSDLGLSILERGWLAHYTNRRYGWGLLPDTFEAFKKQRYRWACGGVQILKKHWRRFLPGASLLDRDQKREFAAGWVNWLAAESLAVVVVVLNLMWVPFVLFVGVVIPESLLTLPIIAVFGLSLVHFVVLYRLRVAISLVQMTGALLMFMSVQWTIARAVIDASIGNRRFGFHRTAKGSGGGRRHGFPAFWEAALGALLVACAVMLIATNRDQIREIYVFAAVRAYRVCRSCQRSRLRCWNARSRIISAIGGESRYGSPNGCASHPNQKRINHCSAVIFRHVAAFLDDHVPFVHIAKGRDVRSQMSLLVPSERPNADEELTI